MQNVFCYRLPGEPGLDTHMCWRCGVQSKPLNYFFFWNLQKDPALQRLSDGCSWLRRQPGIVKYFLHESTTF